jgi:hypothetical protein
VGASEQVGQQEGGQQTNDPETPSKDAQSELEKTKSALKEALAENEKVKKEFKDLKFMQDKLLASTLELKRRYEVSCRDVQRLMQQLAQSRANPGAWMAQNTGQNPTANYGVARGVSMAVHDAEKMRWEKKYEEDMVKLKNRAKELITQEKEFVKMAKKQAAEAREETREARTRCEELDKEIAALKEKLLQNDDLVKEVAGLKERLLQREKEVSEPTAPAEVTVRAQPLASSLSPVKKKRKVGDGDAM